MSSTAVETICQRAWSLSVIDLRYCQNVDASTLMSISQCCNPQCLKELHLDGCEKVDDVALTNLVSKFLDTTQHCWTDVPKLKGGARGLWKLSISECRLVTDQGVGVLRKLKQLADLSILGCYSVTDEGLRHLLRGSKCFKQLNLSGTYITPETLLLIRSTCRDLQSLVLNGCKQLRQDNKDLFPTHVKVDLRDDVFRFQLAPVPGSALQPITSNILRTRGSLAIQRVCHYVLKKLEKDDVAIDVLCKDRVLTPYQTLKEVSRDLWDGGILLLHYQMREETRASEESHLRNCALFRVVKWVPNQLAPLCRSCEEPFSFLTRRHHCRRCGLVFCSKCSDYWRLLPDLGYSTAPVRVCAACR